MSNALFPKGFEHLARHAPEWVLPGQLERQRKRAASDLATVKAFFDALHPEMERIMAYLKTVPMDGMTAADKNLYRLAATWFEMSHPIDLGWPDTDQRAIFAFERIHLVEPSPADSGMASGKEFGPSGGCR